MKPELEKLCKEYISNRDAVKEAFRWENDALHAVCANIFCARGETADTVRLKECRKIIRNSTGFLSKFRSKKVRSILAAMLSMEDKPENRMRQANDYYRLLKRQFKGTEYLVLTAFLLADLANQDLTVEMISRGKEIYARMNRQHRILTDNTDSVFAMLMAFSGKTADELTDETEACYQALKKKFSAGGAQTAAQVLSIAGGIPEEKAQRIADLYDALHEAEIEYGHSGELPPLAALSLAGTPLSTLAEEIKEMDELLKTQKGFDGSKDSERAKRAMYAVMIVSDQYAGTEQVNITVMTNTIDMLIAMQLASRISLFTNLLQFAAQLFLEGKKQPEEEQKKDDATKK